ncbi:hypothetical protein CKAN_01689700 [Cinnamomum micranthum f. kanehirae]|uniref:Uncharacterized protein n=1 Tax=Cinnamomum micranthum f. kanehirae TaxID=337451 RepID=A0A3S3MQL7_9MAGN|nr:hypothetical protein CKAN_01689700 [Cinnamomum micranthum f. kanehirae]
MISEGKWCRLIWSYFRKQTKNWDSLILGVAIAEKEKANVSYSYYRENRGIKSLLVWVPEVDCRNQKRRPETGEISAAAAAPLLSGKERPAPLRV